MSSCPCCSGVLLRHIRHNGIYWFCSHCWQEMPNTSLESSNLRGVISKQMGLAEALGSK